MLTRLIFFGIEVVVFRDDLNHSTVSGNKLHKLAPNIEIAKARSSSSVLSFGGPYSNYLHALAWACKEAGLKSIGVVRGELHDSLTPTLKDCQSWGMQLVPLSRKLYREIQQQLMTFVDPCLVKELSLGAIIKAPEIHDNTLVFPEGGSNEIAIESLARAYAKVFRADTTHVVCATGTGATLAGLYRAAPEHVEVIGMQAVAEQGATIERIQEWLGSDASDLRVEESHLGRFGKITPALIQFIDEFEAAHGIPLDPIYTGKALLRLSEMIVAGYFKNTDKILFIHTGGLQGKRV